MIVFPDSKRTISFDEATFFTLLNTTELSIEDIDLGTHANYDVQLSPEEFSNAFNIIPSSGYQFQTFTLSVANAGLLDYEILEWQNFSISVSSSKLLELKTY